MSEQVHDIRTLQAMDETAWAELQEDYYRRVYFYVKRYVSDHQTAEDLTQDVFLGALRGIPGFDPVYTLDQFVFGIAKNRVIDHYRKHKLPLIPAKSDGDGEKSQVWLENLVPDQTPLPKERAVKAEDEARQRQVLGQILREHVSELWGDSQKNVGRQYKCPQFKILLPQATSALKSCFITVGQALKSGPGAAPRRPVMISMNLGHVTV